MYKFTRLIKCKSQERGAVAVIAALVMLILLGFTGLAIDLGWLYFNKVQLKNAADAGALSGAFQLKRQQPAESVEALAKHDAVLNGVEESNVTVNVPPSSGNFAGNGSFVEVMARRTVTTFFMKLFGPEGVEVVGRSVAGVRAMSTCLMTFDNSLNSFLASQNSDTQMSDCGIQVNGTHNRAFAAGANSIVAAGKINVVGGTNIAKSATVTPTPVEGAPAITDPFAAYSLPVQPATCPCLGQPNCYDYVSAYKTNPVFNPGVYCGGIHMTTLTNFTFNEGIYWLVGNGLTKANAVSYSSAGNGVTFINTYGVGAQQYNYNPLNIGLTGTGAINLSAYTQGPTKGLLFYDNPPVSGQGKVHDIGGAPNGTINLTGIIYAPYNQVNYEGGSTSSAGSYFYIIANKIKLIGESLIRYSDMSPFPAAASTLGEVYLAE